MMIRLPSILTALALASAPFAADAQTGNEQPVLASELILKSGSPDEPLNFFWIAPVQAGLDPVLARSMRAEAERRLAADATEADELAKLGSASARVARRIVWNAAADTPRLLSLWSSDWSYQGGAHGNTSYSALLWDKQTGSMADLRGMMTDPDRGFADLNQAFCRLLDEERARRRQNVEVDAQFTTCPDLGRQAIVPVAMGERDDKISHLSIKVAPYEAGPYAEGDYDITVLVSPTLVEALKPEWRSEFSATEQ